MADNFTSVDIAPIEALHVTRDIVNSLRNMQLLNSDMISNYTILQEAINDDGYDYVLKELNKTKSLIEQSILEVLSIVKITEEYIEYVKQSYEKTKY